MKKLYKKIKRLFARKKSNIVYYTGYKERIELKQQKLVDNKDIKITSVSITRANNEGFVYTVAISYDYYE